MKPNKKDSYEIRTEKHNKTLEKIENADSINKLPKTNRKVIYEVLLEELGNFFDIYYIDFDDPMDEIASYIVYLANALIEKENTDQYKNSIEDLVTSFEMKEEYNDLPIISKCNQIHLALENNYNLQYLVEEVRKIEAKYDEIITKEHERIMNQIAFASDINELPKNVSISSISKYLSNNSVVCGNKKIKSSEFNEFATSLVENKGIDIPTLNIEIRKIVERIYEREISELNSDCKTVEEIVYYNTKVAELKDQKDTLFMKLTSKFFTSKKLSNMIKEVVFLNEKKEEFYSLNVDNKVNLTFILNTKSTTGGNFFNGFACPDDINLLDIPQEVRNMGVDAIEAYVKTNINPNFNKYGALIFPKDLKINNIGKISVFVSADDIKSLSAEELTILKDRLKLIRDINESYKKTYLERLEQVDTELSDIEDKLGTIIDGKTKGKGRTLK